MLRTPVAAAVLIAAVAGCAPQVSVKEAFAQCRLEAQAAKATTPDDHDLLSSCMEARGFEVKDGYCSITASPDQIEACYRRAGR